MIRGLVTSALHVLVGQLPCHLFGHEFGWSPECIRCGKHDERWSER